MFTDLVTAAIEAKSSGNQFQRKLVGLLLLVLPHLLLHQGHVDQMAANLELEKQVKNKVHQNQTKSPHLDRTFLDDLVSQRDFIEDNLTVHDFIDGLALDVEVKELPPLDLGVEDVPDLVPGNGHGDGSEEDLLADGPPGVHLGAAVEVDGVGGGRDLLHHQLWSWLSGGG